ncbi:hypothetical protein [Robertmurraya massiliosenegalensis]|uniref:hypothetical protein n=1 Tax=Robertmurraya massiliosenegalensis TaxID=1287657 RepID=UPI0002E4B155|nr:hypothetical protein [Robertmurraya massiliosenegalensis]
MEKKYVIEIAIQGKQITEMKGAYLFSLDKDDFNKMVQLCDLISSLMFEADYCVNDLMGLDSNEITLKVYSEDEVLFESNEAFMDYKNKYRIESRIRSDFSLVTYVNDIRYYGQIYEGMLDDISENRREYQ